jgi:hypothetical protein
MPCVMPVSRLGLAYGGLDKGMGIMDGCSWAWAWAWTVAAVWYCSGSSSGRSFILLPHSHLP